MSKNDTILPKVGDKESGAEGLFSLSYPEVTVLGDSSLLIQGSIDVSYESWLGKGFCS